MDYSSMTEHFYKLVAAEFEKGLFGTIRPAGTSLTPDELADIEQRAGQLTRQLLDLGLRPYAARAAVHAQFNGMKMGSIDTQSIEHERAAARQTGAKTFAVGAGAQQAILDWLQEQAQFKQG